ncbi:sugar ABC transporter substrate-binding protein [Phyllobacterium endophyticum]|uniref:Periplasmic binding protein domain-containing protein n=1 Tax=Phyllobacterium endophyticum TaxID=1149773 RepID=A0A2P7ARZ0_9HYPH|nr:sugar ABC transporter substrate-binding protein [Phyllobacterium endophyticum]MBB3236703.1 ABC-type sugar transport system substrate-binding protein [Phyllobacterium endophyticum]PSH56996.1 hypothetical protein CU100_17060 [Phyllobacterium endophyticum]TYR39684.1 substrate-binding domain-containing protein [Phyllobacterium endophyticum]
MNNRVVTLVLATGVSILALASGAKTAAACDRTYTIGFSHPTGGAAFVTSLRKKVERFAQENGCVNMLIDNTQANNLETQRVALESWIIQKVDAIVVLPVDAKALSGLQKQAQAKGIKWLTYAAPTPGADGSVGFDNVQSGRILAEDALAWVKTRYPNGGVSAAVTTLTPLKGAFIGRWQEPLDRFKEAGLSVISTQDCGDQECGLRIAEDAIRQNPDLRVFIGFNDDAAVGALRAFTNAKIDPNEVYVAGQDGTPEALEAVRAGGAYRASAAILLDKLAELIVKNSIAAATGAPGSNEQVGVELATQRNSAELEKLIAQYKD